jgi:hypothetical protein
MAEDGTWKESRAEEHWAWVFGCAADIPFLRAFVHQSLLPPPAILPALWSGDLSCRSA